MKNNVHFEFTGDVEIDERNRYATIIIGEEGFAVSISVNKATKELDYYCTDETTAEESEMIEKTIESNRGNIVKMVEAV